MTLDDAVALSLLTDLPRPGLSARLAADDPQLLERAAPLLEQGRAVRARAAGLGILALAWNDSRFPAGLRAIPDMPPVLWYRGTLESLEAPLVAIVGSRSASSVALDTAVRLAQGLASFGIWVVSGLARGVDSAAHRGALRAGRTVAVLGSGLDRIYPSEHATLADGVAASGIVLTEYSPGTPPLPGYFPMRNRLISGLSLATIVVEAAERSGSLITAGCAVDQGREVMVVPGSVAGGRNRGGHALIRDGAALVETAEDVVQQLGWRLPASPSGPAASGSADPILRRMAAGEALDVDTLAARSGMCVVRILQRLGELELQGIVQRVEGGRFLRQS
jgi:DNA processing protein